MNRNKLLVAIISGCVIMGGTVFSNIQAHKALEEVTNISSSTSFNQDSMQVQIVELESKLSSLSEQIDKQTEALMEVLTILERERLLEDYVIDIIISGSKPNQKPTEEQARKLAKLIIKINREYVETFGFKEDIPMMLSIIRVESQFDSKVVSSAGAKGLMQLMDGTGRPIAEKLGFSNYDPFDPEQNIRVAWYYFNSDRERLGEYKAIVAYNQGYKDLSGAVSRSMSRRDSYLNKVKSFNDKYSTLLDKNN